MDTTSLVAVIGSPILGAIFGAATALAVEKYRYALRKFSLYHESQFGLYNELWESLQMLKIAGDALWEIADASNLERFSEQLDTTKHMIEKKALLIEDEHLNELCRLIRSFEDFQLGKERLIDIRRRHGLSELRRVDVHEAIGYNRQVKEQYDSLILEIASSMKRQLKG